MYSFITGVIEENLNGVVVLNCNGVGYEINVSYNTSISLPNVGDVATIYTYLYVREDAFSLFGFSSKQEKEVFLKLITVSGVGAKSALGILSGISPENLITAIMIGDDKLISKIKGVGKKTAERIIVELKTSIGNLRDINLLTAVSSNQIIPSESNDEALILLVDMGLTKMEALKLINQVAVSGDRTEDIIAKALKNMN